MPEKKNLLKPHFVQHLTAAAHSTNMSAMSVQEKSNTSKQNPPNPAIFSPKGIQEAKNIPITLAVSPLQNVISISASWTHYESEAVHIISS